MSKLFTFKRVAWLAVFSFSITIHLVFALVYRSNQDAFGTSTPTVNGDVNGDQVIDISDPIYLIDYIFGSGSPPIAIAGGGSMSWDDGPGMVTTLDSVGIGTTTPTAKLTVEGAFIRTIARATAIGPVETADTGRLLSRTLNFTKTKDETAIRVGYTDNFRVNGQNSSGRWEIRVNGLPPAGGNVQFDIYEASGNHHFSSTLVGYLEGVPAGTHSIEIWVGPTSTSGGDLYTGWQETRWTIEAEEVY